MNLDHEKVEPKRGGTKKAAALSKISPGIEASYPLGIIDGLSTEARRSRPGAHERGNLDLRDFILHDLSVEHDGGWQCGDGER